MTDPFKVKQSEPYSQPNLFQMSFRDFSFESNAQARTFYGAAVEEIICQILSLNPITTDSRFKYCFDAQKGKKFYEIKSVHKSGKVVVYKKRIQNDIAAKVPLYYVLAIHAVRGARTNRAIWEGMSETLTKILVIPARKIQRACKPEFLRTHKTNKEHGTMKYGYEKGYYNLPLCNFSKLKFKSKKFKTEIHGFKFSTSILENK